jgi:hypothetical protein
MVLCGGINVNYLIDTKKTIRYVLATYNLLSRVLFPTRLQNNSAAATENIFIDVSGHENYVMLPLFNGLSDHDAHVIIINYVKVNIRIVRSNKIRKIDQSTMFDFQYELSFRT